MTDKVPGFVTEPDPSLYSTGKFMVLDFETTNVEKGSPLNAENNLVLACWSLGEAGVINTRHYSFGSEYEQQVLLGHLETVDFIVAQNAKFELQWLDRCGYDMGAMPVYDTMLAEWVIGGNRYVHRDLSLDSIAKRRGIPSKISLVSMMIKGGMCPSKIPSSWLLEYCLQDVSLTFDVMQLQLADMEGTRLLPIVYTRCLTTLALADIEKSGAFLDTEAVETEYTDTLQTFNKIVRGLDDLSGGVNMSSSPQKAEYIYETLGFKELIDPFTKSARKTDGGAPKTDASTILALKVDTEEQGKFIKLKLQQGKLHAALTKTLDFFIGVVRERDGMFFGELKQGTARTHRLSSVGRPIRFKMFPKKNKTCQFQNFPNMFKKLITCRHEGWVLGEGDGSQLEFRVGGHLGNDSQIRFDIEHKEDIHQYTADALSAAGEPTSRRAAKASTFRPMYGGTSGSPAVAEYCKLFADKYHELNTTQRTWALVAADTGEIETEWGMKYYFPHVKVQKSGYISGQQQVFNYPIQAFATAEIIPIGLVHFWYRTRNAKLIITNTVHDSIICEIPPDEIELFQVSVVQSLTKDVYSYLHKLYKVDLTVPLGVGVKLGTHWGVTAYTDDELEILAEPLRELGYEPVIDDGEISVDVPNER
jgi:DNA polymerase I-like protein with 3'-5' exonuclease and polymerase domains